MHKKVVLFLFVIFLVIPLSFAETTYNEIGDVEGDYVRGTGIFNTEITSSDTTGTVVVNSNQKHYPLIADLDGDGDTEYTIIDGDTLRIFENNDLGIVDTFAISVGGSITGNERYSNPVAFDIDGDGRVEIIYVKEKTGVLDIIEYNGTSVFAQANINLSGLSSQITSDSASEYALKCQSTNKCIITYANEDLSGFTPGFTRNKDWFAAFVNSSFVGHEKILLDESPGFQMFCQPRARGMAIADYDNDGIDEIITTMYDVQTGLQDEAIHIFWLQVEDNGTIELESTFEETADINDVYRGDSNFGNTCEGTGVFTTAIGTQQLGAYLPENLFTSPITFDFDGSSSNGQETMVAFVQDADDSDHWDFLIKAYDGCSSDLGFETSCSITELDDFPETCDTLNNCGTAHGLTNLYRTNAFPDASAGNVDVCVSGIIFNDGSGNDADEIDTICASKQKTVDLFFFDLETMEILLGGSAENDVPFNVTLGAGISNGRVFNVWHSGQHSSEITNGQNLNEVITPYGIMRIKDGGSATPEWEIIFPNPETEGIMIPVDGEFQESEDLILYSSGNLFYIDDGLANNPAIITSVNFNPCPIDAILKINTTMEINIIVTDQNPAPLSQDTVIGNATVYNNDPNQVSNSFINVSSGALLPFSFNLNKTITNGEILISGSDSVNPTEIDTQSFTLNVQENGIEFGDSECSQEFLPDDAVANVTGLNISAEAAANEGLTDFFEGSSNEFKVTGLVIALFLMLGWSIAVLTTKDKTNDSMITMNKVIFLMVGNIFILILAVIAGVIPFGILLTLIIFGVFAIGIWVRRMFTANNM